MSTTNLMLRVSDKIWTEWKFDRKHVHVLSLAANCSWQVSSLSETKAHQVMQQKATSFIHFNQRQLSRIYPSSYRVDSSNFNPQPFWNAGCQLGTSFTRPAAASLITVFKVFVAADPSAFPAVAVHQHVKLKHPVWWQ